MRNPNLHPIFQGIANSISPKVNEQTDQQKFARLGTQRLDLDKSEPVDAKLTDMNPITMWCANRDIMKKAELINWN